MYAHLHYEYTEHGSIITGFLHSHPLPKRKEDEKGSNCKDGILFSNNIRKDISPAAKWYYLVER